MATDYGSTMYADRILLNILAELEVLADVPEDMMDTPEPYLRTIVTKGVPYRPTAWFGATLPDAARMAYSRAARRLVRDGLLCRLTEPARDRVQCVHPTLDGLEHALELAGTNGDRESVARGLRRTHWGLALADAISAQRDDLALAWDKLLT